MIGLAQVVDMIANPRGAFFLTRNAENVGRTAWPAPGRNRRISRCFAGRR
jgi:hypothetical protein